MDDPHASEPPLHRAARLGDVQEVARLVNEGADIEARAFRQDLTPLMVAVRSTEAETKQVVEWLLTHGAKLRATSNSGRTAAWYAAGGQNYYDDRVLPDQVERLRLLLNAGLDPEESAEDGQSLLWRACRAGDPARVRLLLELGATASIRADSGTRQSRAIPLFAAVESDSAECVQLLLDAGEDPTEAAGDGDGQLDLPSDLQASLKREIPTTGGETALGSAASPAVARLLIAAGADVNSCDWYEDVLGRAFDRAERKAAEGNPEAFAVADVLLEAGASLDRGHYPSWTRLFSAAFSQEAAVVEYLLERGASREPNNRGATPLHAICWQRGTSDPADERIIRTLVAAGFSLADRDNEGRTPLHKATGGDGPHGTAVRVLLEMGAEPNPIDEYGQTPLHLAAIRGGLDCVQTLLANGADPNRKDLEGQTALDYAEVEVKRWAEYAADESATEVDAAKAEEDRRFKSAILEWYLPNSHALLKTLQEAIPTS